MKVVKRSRRFEKLDKRPVNQDSFFVEWPEGGLSAMNSPYDPKPSLHMADGKITEMDGKQATDFDSLEQFIAERGIDLSRAEWAMSHEPEAIAKMIVDIGVPREEVVSITTSITPAKMLQVVKSMNAVEMMMGQMKMRVRKTPANQAIVTNIKDHPALLAADAAEAALRGFAEIETTCAVSRYAPFNALAVLLGTQTCRGGVLTQCSMEESLEVRMGMLGLTSYAETLSLYGTEASMDDGDDTIWSKAFLASVYASRGIKMRVTSGTGAEVLLGHSEKKSMLYLEILCVYLARACGAQGVQNGSISCIGITTAVPEGLLAIAAENLTVSLLDLEVASGNDQTFSHSDLRRTAKLLMQMMPGTDFITSGYSATPNFDDVFAGSNTDCDDYDDYYMIQRDMQIDGGIAPILEEDAIVVRNRAAKACQAVFRELSLPPITDEEVEAATYAYSNEEMPDRHMAADLLAAQDFLAKGINAIDVIQALQRSGFAETAEHILRMLKGRICGDYLQVAAIFDKDFHPVGGLNEPNDYQGPGTGYRLTGERWKMLKYKPSALVPENILVTQNRETKKDHLLPIREKETAEGLVADIVIGISPAFANQDTSMDISNNHVEMLRAIIEGIEAEGLSAAVIKVHHTSDLAEISKLAASYGRREIGIGIQSRGMVRINHKNLAGEDSLEIFFHLPFSSPLLYRDIGINGARYAKGEKPLTISDQRKPGSLTNYQLMMIRLSAEDSAFVNRRKKPVLMEIS